jgi:hypothetical protein
MIRRILLAALPFLLTCSRVLADDAFAGTWVNVDKNTGWITRVEIRQKDGACTIQTWGAAGDGTEIDHGSVMLRLLVDAKDKRKYGNAFQDAGFKHVFLTCRLEKDELVVQAFNVFLDDSRRPNYWKKESFKRKQ